MIRIGLKFFSAMIATVIMMTAINPMFTATAIGIIPPDDPDAYSKDGVTDEELAELIASGELKDIIRLTLRHSQITDLTPLSELTNLTHLDLKFNEFTDISPLSGLMYLSR